MDDVRTFMNGTAPVVEGLFRLLNEYGRHKMQAFVALTEVKTRAELEAKKESYSSKDFAREVVAGSILQVAYVAIASYARPVGKSDNALHFESEINRLIREYPELKPRTRTFELPLQFCVGRDIGHLPLGVIVYAGRNQYNHFHENTRLSAVNELVFNHLHSMAPQPKNGLSFDLKPGKLFSYSVLAALGWVDSSRGLGYAAYKKDMADILRLDP
jgi:hypothetical protein